MIGKIIFIVVIGVILIIYCTNWYSNYKYCKCYANSKLSFEKFLTVYENAPWAVSLCKGYFCYSYWDDRGDNNTVCFYFSISDTLRYEHWRKKLERKEEKEEADAVMEKVEKFWAKDAADALWKRNNDNRELEKENGN